LRVAFRQQRGSLPPSFDALTVNSRVPTFWHALLFSNPADVSDVLKRMTADKAQQRAARYRQLARQMTDAQTREELTPATRLNTKLWPKPSNPPAVSAPMAAPAWRALVTSHALGARMWRRMPRKSAGARASAFSPLELNGDRRDATR
jgi:hypothetical protein